MNRGILIALVVAPFAAQAGPKKKPGGKAKAAPPVEDPQPAAAPAPAPTPNQPASTQPATAPGKPGSPQAAGTAPATPGAPQPPQQPQPQVPPADTGAAGGDAENEPAAKEGDVDTLRQEYLALRDELFKSRARANAVAGQLYSTRMTIRFTWGSPRTYGVSKASIRLDGATVYEDATGAIATDDGIRFDGYVAPGRHLVTFHVEATGKDDDSFTSTTEAQITVKAVANKDLVVAAKGKDNGDIAYAWKRAERGNYGLGIDVGVKSVAQGAKGAK